VPARTCGSCRCYQAELEPDGACNGMGFCQSSATKQIGKEFLAPVGMVKPTAPACNRFVARNGLREESRRVESLLAPPPVPRGVVIERAIEIQGGRFFRMKDSVAVESGGFPLALNSEQRRFCEIQVTSAMASRDFWGKIVLTFGSAVERPLLGWSVRSYPRGSEAIANSELL
jgi:hypothetical protein